MPSAVTDLTDTTLDDRYRLLVDNITDYAIFMLDVNGFVTQLECRSKALQRLHRRGNPRRAFLAVLHRRRQCGRRAAEGSGNGRSEGSFEAEAGGSARMGALLGACHH